MKRHNRELTDSELRELADDRIDYSDIPEPGDEFWKNAELVLPKTKQQISIKVDREVLEFFRKDGPGYQTRMNAVLKSFVRAKKSGEDSLPSIK